MPYKLDGKCVIRADTGETVKCHETEKEAKAHLAALEINVEKGANMEGFSYFLPLTKVVEQDDGTCLVYTRGVQEEPDISDEIFDYASSVPLLKKWSENAFKRSQGKSYGNVRAMHNKQASGLIIEPLAYNDAEKAVDLVVKVVDPVDVKKCRLGVYTGMSIGGRYAKRWPDPKYPGTMRYTAEPIEFSLVDMPNVRSATFSLVKLGGDIELKKFAENAGGTTPVNQSMAERAGSEEYAPEADKVPKADVPEAGYIEKEGVDNASKAPDSMSHGVEAQKVEQIQVPDWAAPLKEAVEKMFGGNLELLKAAGAQVGIERREGEPLQPPVGYPTDSAEYADPANWGWRYDTGEFAKSAVAFYNLGKNRNRYDDREWNILGRRIAHRAKVLLDGGYSYDPVKKRINTMPELKKGGFDQVLAAVKAAAEAGIKNADNPQACLDALHQIQAAVDISSDAGAAPAPKTKDVAATLAMAAEPEEEKKPTMEKEPAAPPPSKAPSKAPSKVPPPPPEEEPLKKEDEEIAPPEEESEMEKKMTEMASTVEKLSKAIEGLIAAQTKQPQAKPLHKGAPYGDLNGLSQTGSKERTQLEKTILAAAAEVSEGVTTGSVKKVMAEAGGDPEEAKAAALRLVRESLAARGFTSAAKIRTISPSMAAQLRQGLKGDN